MCAICALPDSCHQAAFPASLACSAVQAPSGKRRTAQLVFMPADRHLCRQELLQKFREKKVDFAAHTQTEDGNAVFFNLIGVPCLSTRAVHAAVRAYVMT